MKGLRQGGFLIAKIHQITGRVFSRKLKTREFDEINPAQGRILFFLWQHDGISIQEVSKATALEKSTLTSMLDRLEEAGHIQRTPCGEDRRKTLIHVTQKGSGMRAVYEQVVGEMSEVFYRGFSEKEIGQFEEYLDRVFRNLAAEEERYG